MRPGCRIDRRCRGRERHDAGNHGGSGSARRSAGTRVGSRVLAPKWLFSFDEPIANSSMFALPIVTAWAQSRRSTTVAS
jgi:hypothetical protein